MTENAVGIYEKALPEGLSWEERFNLCHDLGFNFVEFSIDESNERLKRLDWSRAQRTEFRHALWKTNSRINTLMLSGHRRFPLGSKDSTTRATAIEMLTKAVDLAVDLGIRNIQLAGYDVYYDDKDVTTRELFIDGLRRCVEIASKKMVMLSIETMDDPFIKSLQDITPFKELIKSPWLQGYPDIGNISAWLGSQVMQDLEGHMDMIAAIHLKDTRSVTSESAGQFKDVPFGNGCVDFEGCFYGLTQLGYSGSYTVEMWSGTKEDPIREIKQAKEFFDRIFAKVGIVQENI